MRKLTYAEINHLINLLNMNAENEEYHGNKKQYWKRHETLYELFVKEQGLWS